MMKAMIDNWMLRHQNPVSLVLHLTGIPMVVASVVVLVLAIGSGGGLGWWALGLFVGGYVLQFAGHAIEGNDAGELILIKKLLGKPYVDIAPDAKRQAE